METIAFILELAAVKASLIFIAGVALAVFLGKLTGTTLEKRGGAHLALVGKKAVFYIIFVVAVASTLLALGVNMTAALGAAGVLSIAIAFAAQTSLSNLISGLFLLGERPFEVGDLIVVGGTRGTVLSIDLLSVKLRTPDNLFIRIPNQSMIGNELTNITRFPIRRVDVNVGVAYKEDPERVISLLKDIADKNPNSLDEPAPLVLFKDFGSSSLDFLLGVWVEKTKFLALKNSIMVDIKKRFDAEGVEIAFPHLTVYTGAETKPFPVRLERGSRPPGQGPASTDTAEPSPKS